MTTPRTMTVSEIATYLHNPDLAESLVGVTIASDPELNFDAMTTWDVLDWCCDNCDGLSEQYRDIRRAISDFANEIADRKGMGR